MKDKTDTRIQFAGLTGADDVEMNPEIQSHYKLTESPDVPLNIAVDALDPVELADLFVQNPYDENQLIPISMSNATINPDTAVELARKAKEQQVAYLGDFGDPAEVDAFVPSLEDGDKLTYATHGSGYAAVAHYDFFQPLVSAIREADVRNISGELRVYDNGAQVHGEIMFQDPDAQLNLPGDRDALFVGLSVGNSYDGSCSMYAMGYAQDTFCKNSMRNLTEKRTRKHIGEPTEVAEWWADILTQMTALRDLLGECITEALEVEIDFLYQPFDVDEFYELLGLPSYLARAAAVSARNRSPQEGGTRTVMNFWTLHSGLTSALTHDFNGSSEVGSLETYSRIAKDILWNPVNIVDEVKTAYEQQQREDENAAEGAVNNNVAMIEKYQLTLEDRKEEFEAFENNVSEILNTQ